MPVDPESAPDTLQVEHTTDHVRVTFPLPLHTRTRIPAVLALVAIGSVFGLLAAVGWLLQSSLVIGLGVMLAAVPLMLGLVVSVGSRMQPRFFWPWLFTMPMIELTRHTLRIHDERGETGIPLASIQRVGIAGTALVVDWTQGRFEVSDHLRPDEYHWMQALITDHAETARIAELELGVDLDRPAVVPQAVSELLDRDH